MKFSDIKGLGPKKASLLREMGITDVDGLLDHFPYDYEDKSRLVPLSEVIPGQSGTFHLQILEKGPTRYWGGKGRTTQLNAGWEGEICKIVYFGDIYTPRSLKVDEVYYLYGKAQREGGKIVLYNPEVLPNDPSSLRLYPKYHTIRGLRQKEIQSFIHQALQHTQIPEILPQEYLNRHGFINRGEAYRMIHEPNGFAEILESRRRFVYEDFFRFGAALRLRKASERGQSVGAVSTGRQMLNAFLARQPYSLTGAQLRVLEEIMGDMASPEPMNRLLQGDVGSGKTILAICAMVQAAQAGYQGVLLAPTEVVARQHYEKYHQLLEEFGFSVGLLLGATPAEEKMQSKEAMAKGDMHLVFGTHALIQEDVSFHRLGLVITDEQHRFGVKQRSALIQKGLYPDVLVMSATPIPRTLTLTIYGDLEVSVLDELPSGRQPIQTHALSLSYQKRIFDFMQREIEAGRQIYVVCPLIADSERDLRVHSAQRVYDRLQSHFPRQISIGLLHGRQHTEEKKSLLDRFHSGDLDILVSTTVVEVGVDVPNASVMLIYNAERFGLAQLHQLRGRVGRGSHASHCILLCGSNSSGVRERMKLMQETTDGFVIAQRDLELRGSGEVLGTMQHGSISMRIGDFDRDQEIIEKVKEDLDELFHLDPLLERGDHPLYREYIYSVFEGKMSDKRLN
ncbi:MAG: ATP-dependent DNA helicase RecG [Tissierellia bacterium]|nr:ATP-dependent DNA helicase RecG [Tissierellia bacterium]